MWTPMGALFPILSSSGELEQVVCQWMDVTRRERVERELSAKTVELEEPHRSLRSLTH